MINAETKIMLDAISTMPPASRQSLRQTMLEIPAELSNSQRTAMAGQIVCSIVGEAFIEVFSAIPKEKQVLAANVCVSLVANALKDRVDWSHIGLWLMTDAERN